MCAFSPPAIRTNEVFFRPGFPHIGCRSMIKLFSLQLAVFFQKTPFMAIFCVF